MAQSLISTVMIICELLHVLIINLKVLEVHPLGSTQGHTTIFELALLIGPRLWLDLSLIKKKIIFHNDADLRTAVPKVTTGSRGYKQARSNYV